ncbi:hypothetical protein ACOSP7_006685 [Xanthoceras sorbifolium]
MITALIKYERLPDFCYGCGFIGHSFRECYNSEVRKNIMEGVEPKFGGWLRASPLDRSKFRQRGEDTSEAILKAQEDIEHVAGVGAEGSSRSFILCWNVRGLGSPRAFLALRKVIRKQSPNLVFLSETRLKGNWAAKVKV